MIKGQIGRKKFRNPTQELVVFLGVWSRSGKLFPNATSNSCGQDIVYSWVNLQNYGPEGKGFTALLF